MAKTTSTATAILIIMLALAWLRALNGLSVAWCLVLKMMRGVSASKMARFGGHAWSRPGNESMREANGGVPFSRTTLDFHRIWCRRAFWTDSSRNSGIVHPWMGQFYTTNKVTVHGVLSVTSTQILKSEMRFYDHDLLSSEAYHVDTLDRKGQDRAGDDAALKWLVAGPCQFSAVQVVLYFRMRIQHV